MKKVILIFISLLLFTGVAKAQRGVSLIGQSKQYILNECNDLYIVENTDDDIIFRESEHVLCIYYFKNGLCYMFGQLIDDEEIAEANLNSLKEKMDFKQDYDNGIVYDGYYENFLTRYIPPSDKSTSWTFLYMKY